MKRVMDSLRAAAWLGWQTESNWTDPLLFAVYSIVKPISASLILVVLYYVITRGRTASDFFAFMFVGQSFFVFVLNLLFGLSMTVVSDREWNEMLKYIYVSPMSFFVYLVGRGFVKFVLSIVAAVVTLVFGGAVLQVHYSVSWSAVPYFFATFALGIIGVLAFGIILAGLMLVLPQHSMMISESIGGVFYMFSGVVFPPDVMPKWLQGVTLALPTTYWLEAMRRVFIPRAHVSALLSSLDDTRILLILLVTTVVLCVLAVYSFRFFENLARRKGLIDRTTGW